MSNNTAWSRKLAWLMVTLFVLSLGMQLFATQADAASVRNKKFVSVVYDDSGSMYGDNWSYANYATQTFAALLNKEDDLYITYMYDAGNSVKIDVSDLSKAVQNIRSHTGGGGTPFDSVKTAMTRLKNCSDNNPNTQYWLVVFTDGAFGDVDVSGVEKTLDKFSGETMANGTNPQIMYMTIGDTDSSFTPHPSNPSIEVKKANNNQDIADNLFDIASRVTGRIRLEDSAIRFADKTTAVFSSNLPLLNISVLVQNANVKISAIKDSDHQDVPIKYSVPVSSPDPAISGASEEASNMHGIVTLAGKDQKNIPAGDYTISFSGAVNPKDVVIMVEPAVELKIKLFDEDGKEIDDLTSIAASDQVSAKADIYEFGTDTPILKSLLPSGMKEQIAFGINGKTVDSKEGLELDNLALAEGECVVSAAVDLPGYFHLETAVDFSPEDFSIDKITAELSYDGSPRREYRDHTFDGNDVVYVTHLKENKTGILFTLYRKDKPIDKTMAEHLENDFKDSISADFKNYTVEIQDNGSFLVYPSKNPFYVSPFIYYLMHHGDQMIGVDYSGQQAEGTLVFRLFREWKEIIIPIVWTLVVLYLLWWFFFKKHFPSATILTANGRYLQYQGRVSFGSETSMRVSWFGNLRNNNLLLFLIRLMILLLPMPSRAKFGGYTLIGQWTFFGRDRTIQVENVEGRIVSSTSKNPRGTKSKEKRAALRNTLYIKEPNGEITRFKIH